MPGDAQAGLEVGSFRECIDSPSHLVNLTAGEQVTWSAAGDTSRRHRRVPDVPTASPPFGGDRSSCA